MDEIMKKDGWYEITEQKDGIYLSAWPPENGGIPLSKAAIIEELQKRDITEYNENFISIIVQEPLGEKIRIADAPQTPRIKPEISVQIGPDNMEAVVSITFLPNSKVTADDILEELQAAGVVYGIDECAIEAIVRRQFANKVVCAYGVLPINGENAYLKYHFDRENQGRPVELADGRIDYKNINKFINVNADDLLLEKIPPTAGIAGQDIFGNPVAPQPGKDMRLLPGKNVTLLNDCQLVAAIDGQISIKDRINVLPVLEIPGDVDYSTGNIDFVGSVIVRGALQCEFSIKAAGNVEILGGVYGGMIEAQSVIISKGIQGMNRTVIKARERVVATFAENATIYADQDVIVKDVVMNSIIYAGIMATIEGRRGLAIGGRISAGEKIQISTAGNCANVNTSLEVAVNPFLQNELNNLRQTAKNDQECYQGVALMAKFLRKRGLDQLNTEKLARLERLEATCQELAEKIPETQQRIADLEKIITNLKPGRINITNTLHPGVTIRIGLLSKNITDSLKFLSIYAANNEIRLSALK
ncbi:MAG: FapA family protein [Pelosinus sp.]|nr:FapA family protein [Pelosinus sp.]